MQREYFLYYELCLLVQVIIIDTAVQVLKVTVNTMISAISKFDTDIYIVKIKLLP